MKDENCVCYANHFTDKKTKLGAGRDISSRFENILQLGSACGVFELLRNSFNLWAKCAKYPKLEIAFSIMGFISAFMYLFNFILMNLWRFEHEGKVCSGDFLSEDDKNRYLSMQNENGYMITLG